MTSKIIFWILGIIASVLLFLFVFFVNGQRDQTAELKQTIASQAAQLVELQKENIEMAAWQDGWEKSGYPRSRNELTGALVTAVETSMNVRLTSMGQDIAAMKAQLSELGLLARRVDTLEKSADESKRRLDAVELAQARSSDAIKSINESMERRFDATQKDASTILAKLQVIQDAFCSQQRENDKALNRITNLEVRVDEVETQPPTRGKR